MTLFSGDGILKLHKSLHILSTANIDLCIRSIFMNVGCNIFTSTPAAAQTSMQTPPLPLLSIDGKTSIDLPVETDNQRIFSNDSMGTN